MCACLLGAGRFRTYVNNLLVDTAVAGSFAFPLSPLGSTIQLGPTDANSAAEGPLFAIDDLQVVCFDVLPPDPLTGAAIIPGPPPYLSRTYIRPSFFIYLAHINEATRSSNISRRIHNSSLLRCLALPCLPRLVYRSSGQTSPMPLNGVAMPWAVSTWTEPVFAATSSPNPPHPCRPRLLLHRAAVPVLPVHQRRAPAHRALWFPRPVLLPPVPLPVPPCPVEVAAMAMTRPALYCCTILTALPGWWWKTRAPRPRTTTSLLELACRWTSLM